MRTFSRADWNARPPKEQRPPLVGVQNVALHHIGGGPAWPSNPAATLWAIQGMEQNSGYVDIAYNRGVDLNGDEWEVRGDVVDGATLGYAGSSLSILVICNGAAAGFFVPQVVVDGIVACIKSAQARGVVANNPRVTVQDHRWFDSRVTTNPTWCASDGVRSKVEEIQARVLLAPGPVPLTPPVPTRPTGEPMQFYDKVHPSHEVNRHRSVTVLPDGKIFRNNWAKLAPTPPEKSYGPSKYYDVPATFTPGEVFVGANYAPDGSNGILYQTQTLDGAVHDRNFSFVA